MELGKIDSVDIRTQWENEEYDFTPWLAQEPNHGDSASPIPASASKKHENQ